MELDLDRSNVSVPGDRSLQFWIYLRGDADALIEGGGGTDPKVDGVGYGAGEGATAGADIRIHGHAEVFGAVLGNVTEISQDATVHFDRGLLESSGPSGRFPTVK